MLRETLELSKGGRALLQGRGPELRTAETEGQMLQRVMPELMGMKNVMVFNDEAHHCYRERPKEDSDEEDLKGDDRKEAEKNSEAAAGVDLRVGSGAGEARPEPHHRPVGDTVLSPRLRLRRGDAVPMDDE